MLSWLPPWPEASDRRRARNRTGHRAWAIRRSLGSSPSAVGCHSCESGSRCRLPNPRRGVAGRSVAASHVHRDRGATRPFAPWPVALAHQQSVEPQPGLGARRVAAETVPVPEPSGLPSLPPKTSQRSSRRRLGEPSHRPSCVRRAIPQPSSERGRLPLFARQNLAADG